MPCICGLVIPKHFFGGFLYLPLITLKIGNSNFKLSGKNDVDVVAAKV